MGCDWFGIRMPRRRGRGRWWFADSAGAGNPESACCESAGFFRGGSGSAFCFHAEIGGNEATSVAIVTDVCGVVCPSGVAEVFDGEAGDAQIPDQLLQPVQVFGCA